MSIATGIAPIDTVLIPSSPILEPQSSSANSKGPLVPSKYFGNASNQTDSENGGDRAVVEDSFGLRLHSEGNEQGDEDLPALEHMFKRRREEREKPQGKRDYIGTTGKDIDAIYRKGRPKTEEGTTSLKTSHKLRIEDNTDKVVSIVIDSSSQGAEESTYFNSTSNRGIVNIDVAPETSIEPIAKPLQAREEKQDRRPSSTSTSKSKGAKATVISEGNPKPERRGKAARSVKNVLDST